MHEARPLQLFRRIPRPPTVCFPSPREPAIIIFEPDNRGAKDWIMNLPEFKNEPLSNFKSNPDQARQMQEALDEVRKELGRKYDLVIGGRRITSGEKFNSENPGQKGEVVGVFSKATVALAEEAIRVADETFKTWSRTPAEARVEL